MTVQRPVEKRYDQPVEWKEITLGDTIDSIVGGGTPPREVSEYWQAEIPWASVKDLKSTFLHETEEYISKLGLEKSAANLIPKGTLIIATRMALGKAVFFSKDVAINQDLKAIFPKPYIDKRFLFYWFQMNAEMIAGKGSGSTVKGIRVEVLKNLPLYLPPKEEQTKIAEILSTVDEKIEVIDAQISKTEELKKGLVRQLMKNGIGHSTFKESSLGKIPESWKVTKLQAVCKKITVGFVGTCEKHYVPQKEGIMMLRTGNLSKGRIITNDMKYVSTEFHKKNRKSEVANGDILVARHGISGQAVLVPDGFPECNCLNIVIIRAGEMLLPQFLQYQFNSSVIRNQIRKKTAGSTQGVINTGEIASLNIVCRMLRSNTKFTPS